MASGRFESPEPRSACWWVALTALGVRSAVLAVSLAGYGPLGRLDGDPDSYRQIAETLSQTGVYGIADNEGGVDATAFRSPLYPWILSWLARNGQVPDTGIAILHACLAAATAGLTYSVVYQLSPQRSRNVRGWMAAAIVTLDPLLVMQSSRVMTETLAAFLFVAAWWTVIWLDRQLQADSPVDGSPSTNVRRGSVGSAYARPTAIPGGWLFGLLLLGSLLAAGFLCRPIFLVWTAFLCGWWVVRCWTCHASVSRCVSMIGLLLLPVIVTLVLWTARNSKQLGRPVWATSHGGYTLLLGNNPSFYNYLDQQTWLSAAFWGDAWDDGDFQEEWRDRQSSVIRMRDNGRPTQSQDLELQLDDTAKAWAKETIRQQPLLFSKACTVRFARLWSPLARIGGSVRPLSWVIAAYYVALYLIVGLRLIHQRWSILWRPEMAGFLFAIALSCVHLVYWSNARMRAPVVPFIAAMAVITAPPRDRRGVA